MAGHSAPLLPCRVFRVPKRSPVLITASLQILPAAEGKGIYLLTSPLKTLRCGPAYQQGFHHGRTNFSDSLPTLVLLCTADLRTSPASRSGHYPADGSEGHAAAS